jgi:hypothetical protein
MIYDVLIGAISSGVNKPTWLLLNLALAFLWLTLAVSLYFAATSTDPAVTWLTPHAAVMLGLCTFLAVLVNWFVANTGLTSRDEQERSLASKVEEEPHPVDGEENLDPELREKLKTLPLQSDLDFGIKGVGEFDTQSLAIQPLQSSSLGIDGTKDKHT